MTVQFRVGCQICHKSSSDGEEGDSALENELERNCGKKVGNKIDDAVCPYKLEYWMWVSVPKDLPKEQVDHPSHYGGVNNVYEVIKVLENWLTHEQFTGFLIGNVIKYVARAEHKGGIIDHEKAQWYQSYLTEYLTRKRTEPTK